MFKLNQRQALNKIKSAQLLKDGWLGGSQILKKAYEISPIKVRMKYLENFFKCILTSRSRNLDTFSLSAAFRAQHLGHLIMKYWRTHTFKSARGPQLLYTARGSEGRLGVIGGHGHAVHSACQTSGDYPSPRPRPRLASLTKRCTC